MNFRNTLLSALGVIKNADAANKGATVSKATITKFAANFARSTPINLDELKYIRDNDENVNLAANSIAEAVAGNGFEIFIEGRNANGEPISDKIKEQAQDYCRQFANDADLDTFNLETVAEYVSIGASFSSKIFEAAKASITGRRNLVSVARLPIDDNWQVELPKFAGGPEFVKAYQHGYNSDPMTPEELILWRSNRTSSAEWYGRGICWYMAQEKSYTLTFSDGTTKTYTAPPMYVTLWALADDLRLATRHMAPKTIMNAPGQGDAWVTENSAIIADMNAGESILMNAKQGIDVKTTQADPRFRVDALLNFYDQQLLRMLQAPSMAIYSKEGYSGIFAEQVLNQFARKITALKRYHARKIERELLAPILLQNGIDARYVRPRVYWRPDTKTISQLQDMVALFTSDQTASDFTPDERRDIYRHFGLPISGTAPTQAAKPATATTKPISEN